MAQHRALSNPDSLGYHLRRRQFARKCTNLAKIAMGCAIVEIGSPPATILIASNDDNVASGKNRLSFRKSILHNFWSSSFLILQNSWRRNSEEWVVSSPTTPWTYCWPLFEPFCVPDCSHIRPARKSYLVQTLFSLRKLEFCRHAWHARSQPCDSC